MRLNKDDTGLRLVTSARERQLVDAAFEEVLNRTPLDDWQVRTGASRDELWTVWWSLAGKRSDPQSDEDAAGPGEGSTEISERALEVLEPVLFEVARARLIPESRLSATTGAGFDEWRALWRRARELIVEAWVQPALDDAGEHALLPAGAWSGDRTIGHFRHLGGSLADATVEGIALEVGDARAAVVTGCTFRDVACRAVRLVDSRLADCSISGTFSGGAVIDCDLEGVSVSGSLTGVRFVGNAYRLVDLRSAMLAECRFYDVGPERDLRLPDGPDCFVVRRRTLPQAFSTLRGRVGERTHRALDRWFEEEDAEYVSVAAPFWQAQIVPRGGESNPEVETAVLDRLYRTRCATLV